MGLGASVYCDCLEQGRLRSAPRPEWGVFIAPDGSRQATTGDIEQQIAFEDWDQSEACEHENGVFLRLRLGNIALIAAIRDAVKPYEERLPVIRRKVIYNGVHSGDFLAIEDVEALRGELDVLAAVHDAESESELRDFERRLAELVSCSLRLRKPIVF